MARYFGLVLLLAAAQAHKVQRNVVLRGGAHEHHLRVCNAYAYEAAVDILRGQEKLTKEKPLPYRQCHDFDLELKAGPFQIGHFDAASETAHKVNDKLDFRLGNATTGTFSVSDVPSKNALLLLVVFRHDVESTAVSFESHVFLPDRAPQVAIIDTFLGTSDFKPVLWDGNRTEKLRFGRVISVKPGKYSLRLQNDANETEGLASMGAREGKTYVALRLGAKAEHGPSFPEDHCGRSPAMIANMKQTISKGFATVASLRRRPKPEAPRLAFVAIKPEADCPGIFSRASSMEGRALAGSLLMPDRKEELRAELPELPGSMQDLEAMPVRVVCLGHDELSELCKKAMNLVDDITSTAESDRGSSGQGR
eukprot:symbB.v1.2.030797.t2/scaffold3510.1/size55064/7